MPRGSGGSVGRGGGGGEGGGADRMHRSVSGGWGRGRLTVCPEDRGAQWGGAGGGGGRGG